MSGIGRTDLLRFAIQTMVAGDVVNMKKQKKVDPCDVQGCEEIEFIWKIRRQVQQEILENKLLQCFLKGRSGHVRAPQYPEAMDPMIKDFMRRAEQETKRMGLRCV